jgi:hypothetical protein
MTTTTNGQAAPAERTQERKEPTYLFTEKYVAEKSEIARRFLDTRERLNGNVDKANNFLVKRFYNIDHNTYLEGALSSKTKELMGLVRQRYCAATTAFSITRFRRTGSA